MQLGGQGRIRRRRSYRDRTAVRGVGQQRAEQDSEVADYVRTLEEAKDATDLPEASGDAIAREFERYLRRRGDPG